MKLIGINQEVREKYEKKQEEKEKANTKEIECPTCGAILRYYRCDVKEEYQRVSCEEDETLYYYVVCPHCKKIVITQDLRKKKK